MRSILHTAQNERERNAIVIEQYKKENRALFERIDCHEMRLKGLARAVSLSKLADAAEAFNKEYGHLVTPKLANQYIEEALLLLTSKRDEDKERKEKELSEAIIKK